MSSYKAVDRAVFKIVAASLTATILNAVLELLQQI